MAFRLLFTQPGEWLGSTHPLFGLSVLLAHENYLGTCFVQALKRSGAASSSQSRTPRKRGAIPPSRVVSFDSPKPMLGIWQIGLQKEFRNE
jgi:hypothetical protein